MPPRRKFDVPQIVVDGRLVIMGPNQQMNMLRHEDECHQRKSPLLTRSVDFSSQFLPDRVVRQQRDSPVAGKRQLVQITRLMIVLDRLVFPLAHRRACLSEIAGGIVPICIGCSNNFLGGTGVLTRVLANLMR